jgi:hypothetical protein
VALRIHPDHRPERPLLKIKIRAGNHLHCQKPQIARQRLSARSLSGAKRGRAMVEISRRNRPFCTVAASGNTYDHLDAKQR